MSSETVFLESSFLESSVNPSESENEESEKVTGEEESDVLTEEDSEQPTVEDSSTEKESDKPHEHTYGEWKVVKNSSCTEEGVRVRTCVCGDNESEKLPLTEHTEVTDKAKEPTCTGTGLTNGKHCSVCQKILIAQEVMPANGHIPGEWKITKEATCTEAGSRHKVCTVCDAEVETETVPAGHTYFDGICTVCGKNQYSLGLRYELNADGQSYSVTGIGSCKDTDVYVPPVYNGLPVTSIRDIAFDGCSNLKYNEYDNGKYLGNESNPYLVFVKAKDESITSCDINENTKIIYDYAFYKCSSLKSIEIPDGATSIGEWAFFECRDLTSITYTGTKVQWNDMNKGHNWNSNTGKYTIHCTDGDIEKQ